MSVPSELVSSFRRFKTISMFFQSASNRYRRPYFVAPERVNLNKLAVIEVLEESGVGVILVVNFDGSKIHEGK